MFQNFFIKIYFLFLFLFLFILILQQYFEREIFYILISLYWVLLIPLKWFFTNNFQKPSWNFSLKNIFSHGWVYVLMICILIGYVLSFNSELFLLSTFYIFLISFKIHHKNIFLLGCLYFIWFLYFFFTNPDTYIYSSYLIFFLYSIVLWIFLIIVWENFFSNLKYLWNILLIIFILCLMGSFYVHHIIPYLPLISFATWVCFEDIKKNYISNIKSDSIIFSLFIIWLIPLINDYTNFEEKNIILLGSSIWFLFLYIWYNIILKKALS